MNNKKQPFHYRILKARVAETLIKELFKLNNYNVFNFGMEEVMPGIVGSLNKNNTPEANNIRQLPDFVVQNRDTGDLNYVEVKYRHNGKFMRRELPDDFKYTNAFFIIVHKEGINCISFVELSEIGYLPQLGKFKLSKQTIFNLSEETIKEFENYIEMFFTGIVQ